jgi:4-hydroxy-3-polyprenylbenzoate decarboxylase
MQTYRDLRQWMEIVDGMGELQTVRGAHWNLELGAITDAAYHVRGGPAVLFDDIPDYPSGYRVLINTLGSLNRLALTLGLEPAGDAVSLLHRWRAKKQRMRPTPPELVSSGPLMQNVQRGDDVKLGVFPTPFWHEEDGGRYLGTGCAVITRHPETDWINLGAYRVMVHDDNHAAVYISPGKHGDLHRQVWDKRGEPMPVAVSIGHDPLMLVAGFTGTAIGVGEYDIAGAIKEGPINVIQGPVTGLPLPADAEIAIEGYMLPETRLEGPFGEWLGYYASGARPERVVKIEGVYFRDDPIIHGAPPVKPPSGYQFPSCFLRSADLWGQLEAAGLPGLTGVWSHEIPGLYAVSIKQMFAGHAMQAGMLAAQCKTAAYLSRVIVVVDEDIDVSDLGELQWAMCTRADPATAYHTFPDCWSSPLDPLITPEHREQKYYANSRVIINATRPYRWRDEFPKVNAVSPEYRRQIAEKWGETLAEMQRRAHPGGRGE